MTSKDGEIRLRKTFASEVLRGLARRHSRIVGNSKSVSRCGLLLGTARVVHAAWLASVQPPSAWQARSSLARHFSTNMVDELASMDERLGAGRSQQVGVLFADVVGFTGFAETKEPHEVLGVLREILSMMAEQVFAHGGTIDKYLGDGIMATFGTPHKGKHDAANALACARGILEDNAKWNDARERRGEPPLHIGVGVHYGPVVLGDIGDERRLEFTVIGDTVNVASRAERLTRNLGVDLVASDDLVETVRRDGESATLCDGLNEAPPQAIRGREETVPVWTMSLA